MEPRPTARPVVPSSPRPKPDPRRLRFAYAAGGLATLSAIVTAMVIPPAPVVSQPATASPSTTTAAALQGPIQYVQLGPGQSPPPGATVIDAQQQSPVTVVTKLPAPTPQTVVIRTTQSGKKLP